MRNLDRPPASSTFPRVTSSVLADSIRRARDHAGTALLPFVAAGFPDLATTVATIDAVSAIDGVGAIEVGFPFSDPVADGPVIQEAFVVALEHGVTVAQTFDALAASQSPTRKPLVAMVSFSLVFRYGIDRFFADAKRAGFAGILCPDLPPPEAQAIASKVAAAGLEFVLLVAPTTSTKRRDEIVRLCTGFVYYLSVSGITGERASLPADLAANVTALRSLASVPVCVGFGISKPEHMAQLRGVGDGAIVGTAIVRRIRDHAGDGPAATAAAVAAYCRTLVEPAG